eukprot:8028778-Alexandrium_andersonii.AAC.1
MTACSLCWVAEWGHHTGYPSTPTGPPPTCCMHCSKPVICRLGLPREAGGTIGNPTAHCPPHPPRLWSIGRHLGHLLRCLLGSAERCGGRAPRPAGVGPRGLAPDPGPHGAGGLLCPPRLGGPLGGAGARGCDIVPRPARYHDRHLTSQALPEVG